ncbi:DUF2142 domain-containing protein [Kibdelosporangium philippinense]|uniref:DUF2142 domain-containing protein n=1 Tax=Kibdelosporangium philippinense TaxID=211113 RepID=A0ABS8ZSR0_9PSEU|nr:DUF2142 domain-containing protein [Kibdelosporangium philippinense]MCE7008862.1 DUF2142 domain-containing protein [Kibdelosporangium philippinense]
MTERRSGVWLWLLAFAGFMLIHAGWAFAAPYDGPPDEEQHVLRAAGIMQGDIIPEDRNQTIPESLDKNNRVDSYGIHHSNCFPMRPTVAASCAEEPGGDTTLVRRYVAEARFNPIYYATVGWPLSFWPEWKGVMSARLINGALMSAMLAFAVVAAVRWTRHKALLAGLVAAATPMIAHLGGAINPNGIEITSGLTLAVALIALLHEKREDVNRAAVALAGVSGAVLVTPRFSGVMWLLVIFGVMLVPASMQRVKYLFRQRIVKVWGGVIVLATVLSAAWTLYTNTAEVADRDLGYQLKDVLRSAFMDMWPNITNQMVGVMGWADTLMPRLVYVIWFAVLGFLVLAALVVGKRVDRWRMIAYFIGTFVPYTAMEIILINQTNWFNQGRYFLPGAVGIPLLAAHIMAYRLFTAEHFRSMTRLLATLLLPLHFICLWFTMTRWNSGMVSFNPFNGSWTPPYGNVLPLVLGLLGVVVLWVMYWRSSQLPKADAGSAGPQQLDNSEELLPATAGRA